jgi:predicted MFS family arabinose efflux permease
MLLTLRRLGPLGQDAVRSARRRRALLRDPAFLGLLGVMLVLSTVFFQVFFTLPLYFKQVYGLGERRVGLVFAFNALLIAVTEMLLIRRLERRDPARLLAAGVALVCVGLGLMPLGRGFGFALATVCVWTVGEMLSLPFSNVLVARRGGAGGSGPAMGLYTAVFSIAAVLAPAAGMFVYHRIGPHAVWWFAGALAVPLAATCLALAPRLRGPAPDALPVEPAAPQ